ncbi:hypothetical protein [Lactobacillus agrestimuris]|uniref:hypothetical protein n=1 Tax=Lactobacillus agrestimuris TaxID=2941328 RepID=UPI0020442A96|nr:hypothetical protein [Lactobacillus agrestimuris]
MNPDFAIILNFKLADPNNIDPDQLVRTARNIGIRAINANDLFKTASEKYTIKLIDTSDGQDLTADNVIDTIVSNRKNNQATIINVNVNEDGQIDEASAKLLDAINNWMHMFGHALNEGTKSDLTVDDETAFVLENRHAAYQKYVFIKEQIPAQIIVSGLSQEPNRVEWIEHRETLEFNFKDNELKIKLSKPIEEFEWNVLRIQAHRPEDDIAETKF